MKEKFLQFVEWCNQKGVPVPFVRYSGQPSLSTTLVVVSTSFVACSLIENIHPYLKVDIQGAFQWAALCYGLALGHRVATGTKGEVKIEPEKKGE